MRRLVLAMGGVAVLMLFTFVGSPAQAAVHGCVSSSNLINVTSGDGGPVKTGTCTFTMVAGDTYSGIGPFTVSCPAATKGTWKVTHGASDAPVNQEPLKCKVGKIVTVDAQPGGSVAAGATQ